jgi:hypothetical protein
MTLLSALTEKTSPVGTDMVYALSDPSGTPADAKISLANIISLAPTLNTRFAVNAGNVTSNVCDLLTYTTGTLKTKTGGSYVDATVTNAQGTVTTVSTEKTLNMAGYSNGTYNVFFKTDGSLEVFNKPVANLDFYCDFSQGAAVDNYRLCVPTVAGSPTYTNNRFNGSGSDGLCVPFATFGTDAWCIKGKFYFTDLSTAFNVLFDTRGGSPINSTLTVYVDTDAKISFLASSNGSTADIANNIKSTTTLNTSTEYYIRCSFSGTEYNIDVSLDDLNWTNYISVTSSSTIYATLNGIQFGINYTESLYGIRGYMDELMITIGDSTCVLKNQLLIQPGTPLYPKTNDIWVKSLEPLSAYIYTSGNFNTSYTGTYLGTATVVNGAITVVTTQRYNENASGLLSIYPSNRYITIPLKESGSGYVAPETGYFRCIKFGSAEGQFLNCAGYPKYYRGVGASDALCFQTTASSYATVPVMAIIPVEKDETVYIYYNLGGATVVNEFIYAEGAI